MSSHAKKSAAIPVPAQSTISSVEFEQRFDVLAAKVDLLLAAFGLSEGAADLRWRSVSGQNTDAGAAQLEDVIGSASCSPLAQMGTLFVTLRLRRDALRQVLASAEKDQEWTPELEARAETELNPVLHRLYGLAHALAASPAHQDAELQFKALAIQEYCEEQSDDVVHVLAASLAADILARRT